MTAHRMAQQEKQPTKYWLPQLGPQPLGLPRLVRIARACWRVEQDYRELKEELGLNNFEGRHWLGGIIACVLSPWPMLFPSSNERS